MTVQEQARRRLDEVVPRFWDDDDLDDWCLEAALEVARRTETLQRIALMAVSAGENTLTLPDSALRVHQMLWRCHDPNYVRALQYVPQHAFYSTGRLGEPWSFTIWGREVMFDLAAASNSTLYVVYWWQPEEPTDIPAGWEDLVVDYCEYQALRKDRDPRQADVKALFETKVQQMIETTRQWTDQASQIAPVGLEFYFVPILEPVAQARWDEALWDQGVWG